MTEKLKPQAEADVRQSFLDMRPYFGVLAADAPLYLVIGNHEGELGWLLTGKNPLLPGWSARLRREFYPNPLPDGLYSGSTAPEPSLGSPRAGYYAWTWGDALFIVLDPFWYTTA